MRRRARRRVYGAGDFARASALRLFLPEGLTAVVAGKFNMSNAKSDIDWLVYKAARLPGPGQYAKQHKTCSPHSKNVTRWPRYEVDHSLKYLMQVRV